jgi:YidC/Oxa1 family membrane protein insertase
MAESSSGKPAEKKELSVETRLLLAFILMGVVLFTTPYFYKATTPPAPVPAKKADTAKTGAAAPAGPESPAPAATAAPPPGQVSASAEETVVVDTDVYRIVFSNRGAVVQSWTLKKYNDSNGKPLELVNTAAAASVGYPFSLSLQDAKPPVDPNAALYAVKKSPDGLHVEFEFSDGSFVARKSFQFDKATYLSQVVTEVAAGGARVPHLIRWRGGFGDMTVPAPAAAQKSLHYDASAGKLILTEAGDAKDGPVTAAGNFTFAGIQDTYFAAVFLPRGATTEIRTVRDQAPTPANPTPEHLVGVAVGGDGINRLAMFVGPKDIDILKSVDPRLEQVVDFGRWLGFLAKPLFLAMNWLNNSYVHNYGWAIIIVTVLINFLMLPLKFSSLKSMKKMSALQPQIAAINDKYKNIGMRDPRKQEQNQEIMALYQKHGVNPLGGCLPLMLQMPFLIAFYNVFSVAIEMRGASWLWVTDLSRPETIPIRMLPILMIVTQFAMQKMTPTTGGDPAQQRIMLFMPLMFGFMFYSASAGLVLYWLTSNIVGIAQQWFFNKTSLATVAAQSIPPPKTTKKNVRK